MYLHYNPKSLTHASLIPLNNTLSTSLQLLQRACCLVCLQEWDRAIDDYSLIDFQPNLIHVICMRARTYACQRKWSYAQKDYEYVLRTYPDDEMALKGLEDLNHIYETLPMSIPDRDI
jgi:tetratricopeptide (TPR) repeat protein